LRITVFEHQWNVLVLPTSRCRGGVESRTPFRSSGEEVKRGAGSRDTVRARSVGSRVSSCSEGSLPGAAADVHRQLVVGNAEGLIPSRMRGRIRLERSLDARPVHLPGLVTAGPESRSRLASQALAWEASRHQSSCNSVFQYATDRSHCFHGSGIPLRQLKVSRTLSGRNFGRTGA
jgi:hypothetical protein